jgi:hypothetical protein
MREPRHPSVIVMTGGASLAAVPRALGLGDLARGLSAIGGASDVEVVRPLPAGLAHAGEFSGVGHLPQADPAEAELAEDRVRTTAPLATGVSADGELGLAVRLLDQSLLGHWFLLPAQRVVATTG